jgi:phage gp45-like
MALVDFSWLMNAVRLMGARGKVAQSAIGPRTLLQVTRHEGETFNSVELILPPGYAARPLAGSDLLVFQVGGLADHKVALGGDNTADTVADLQPGEFGIATAGKRVILRKGYVEIVDPVEIRLVAPLLHWSPDGVTFFKLTTEQHTHGNVQNGGGFTNPPATGLT